MERSKCRWEGEAEGKGRVPGELQRPPRGAVLAPHFRDPGGLESGVTC